ncbi:thiamine phosphate synthase [Victivallis vadensis]|uniref:Thiamine-phosphate synthase n=1 Tax=Victivallis vadensis TaxID=172901 RepID=A0A2U1B4H2_9BACT|nr:thiamine phosphate synthase [Victivallis vadensis]NMD85086.1 thiamine phosphate synthase [Victivallis vadensis]PVY43579.1 thiamine-phosphate diphosphorylase [Victivallis vadensis]
MVLQSCFSSREEKAAAFDAVDIYPVISSEFTLGRPVVEIFEAVAAGGVKIVQLREKNKGMKYLYELAVACRPIANRYGILLMIDDHVDVALAANADGVHLGQDDLPVPVARAIAPGLWLGNSTHNLEEALAAKAAGADCINIGPIYPTQTKSVNCGALGLGAIGRIAPEAGLPFSVMGGIKKHCIPELLAAGAKHIAMVTEITQAPDVEARVRELRALFNR